MASQGVSRKRPAPGSSPPNYQQQMNQGATGYGGGFGPQLSNDQFLQWGQSAQQPDSFNDPATYDNSANNFGATGGQASNQLTRRLDNQLTNRSRAQNTQNGLQWMSPAGGAAQQLDSAWGDDIEELERRAQIAKQDSQGKRKQIPPFVQKLNSFLDDGKNNDLIRWSDDGNSFIVLDEDEFAKTLIPELFKHNNYASFVRQLNMYGFHKKVGLSDNSMRASERKNKSPSEYSNPYFRRGHPDLLWLISKPKTTPGPATKGKGKTKAEIDQNDDEIEEYAEEIQPVHDPRPRHKPQLAISQGDSVLTTEQFTAVQRELAAIRHQQAQISRMMAGLKHEHQQLYGQAANFQDQHTRHENSINAILTFLATVYNRSLQGHEGAPGITNLFAGSIPHEGSQGNVVDVGDFSFDHLNGPDVSIPKPFKKPPLLLQAPPSESQSGRASTISPPSTNSSYQGRQTRRMSQALHSATQSGTIEELLDSNQPTPLSQIASPGSSEAYPQRDIMSVIQNTNARNSSLPNTPATDFSNVLTSLENSGGNVPLTNSQRADMLRLINSSTNQAGDNALISPNPPSMPSHFDRKLASTQADLDNLAKLQAEQDRSVQNLTNLLQPLSPTGSIPGIGDGTIPAAPPLDIDDFLSHSDYFNTFSNDGVDNFDFDGTSNGNGIDFSTLAEDNDELFGNIGTHGVGGGGVGSGGQQDQQHNLDMYNRGGLNAVAHDADDDDDGGGGRVESVGSSEVTTPANTGGESNDGLSIATTAATRGKGRRQSGAADGGASPAKRRRRNA